MTLDPDLLDQAYHLFAEEALELLQQIQETLLELPRDSSLSKVHSLVRAINTIESGAAQVNLTDIYTLASRFENIFRWLWQEKIAIDPMLEDLIWQAYEYLRQSLLAQIQTHQEEASHVLAKAEPIFARLEARLGHTPNAEVELLTFDNSQEEGTEWLLNQEVAQALTNLETLLSSDFSSLREPLRGMGSDTSGSNRLEELKIQIEGFLSLGELLNISEFVAIAQISLATLQVSPQTALTIGQLALTGFRGIWEAGASDSSVKTKQDRSSNLETAALEQLLELDRDKAGFSRELDEPIDRDDFVVETRKARDCLAVTSEWVFKTANSLVWLANSAAFILSCEKVKEILLLQTEQLTYFGGQPWLSWRRKNVPVYFLSQLLEYNCPIPTKVLEFPSCEPMLVIFERDEQTVAIELTVDRLLAVPELVIKPFGSVFSPPSYCWGCMIVEGDRLVVAIDLEALLDDMLDRARNIPTILVIDDSITSRQLLVLTLQKAGYRVIQASNGEEGLQQLQQNADVHLVVSDIEMPKLNGFGFLKACRQIPKTANIPIILLSTYNSDRHRQMARELGAAAYLCKPFDKKDFLSALDAILKKPVRR
ncbi:MAG: response regulator [Hydrococcus sp. Prado102]|jgi:chemotaxis protein histidine kinase CheA|nr:response regulator [Hydrococcus sp. Prado102]